MSWSSESESSLLPGRRLDSFLSFLAAFLEDLAAVRAFFSAALAFLSFAIVCI